MTTRKTTSTRATTKKPTTQKAATATEPMSAPAATGRLTKADEPKLEKAPRRSLKQSSSLADSFCLHLGQGFSLLTQKVPGGVTTAARVPAGATLEIAYWKEVTPQPTRVTMHVRLDGEAVPALVVAERDAQGRLLRLSPTLTLPATAKLLEYWFELETDGGHRLWDSNWGNNHWLELGSSMAPPQGEAAARAEA